jgi:hypothetical protein
MPKWYGLQGLIIIIISVSSRPHLLCCGLGGILQAAAAAAGRKMSDSDAAGHGLFLNCRAHCFCAAFLAASCKQQQCSSSGSRR